MFRTSLLNTVAFSMLQFAKGAALQVVEPETNEPEVITQTETQSAGDPAPVVAEPVVEAPEGDKPVVAMDTYDLDELDDLKPRNRAAAIDFGFKDWPVGGHGLVTADLADRARSAVQNAKLDGKKDNGKQFLTRSAVGLKNKAGVLLYPDAKKGDIEVVRIRDKAPVEAPTETVAPVAETAVASEGSKTVVTTTVETKVLENA